MKLTTSKKLLWWAVYLTSAYITFSCVAWLWAGAIPKDLLPLIVTIITTAMGGYFAHSSFDKNSVNKHCNNKEV